MRNLLTILLVTILLSSFQANAANFSNFIENHSKLQRKISVIQSKITINENQLKDDGSDLRSLKKDLKKINKRHKRIYKSLLKKFKIPKSQLELIKTHQKSMKFKRNDSELQPNLINSYKLASTNNIYLKSVIENNKAKAYTDSTGSGVYGTVSMITGNCMPTIGKEETTCQRSGYPTSVIIRKLTSLKDLEHYTHYAGDDEPLLNLSTDDSGVFKTELTPGEYSLFILDDMDKEYCNSYDGLGNACKITIKEDMFAEFNAALDRAAY